jgi:hemolysin III
VTAKWTFGFRFPRLSTAVYLGMGWMILVATVPLVRQVPPAGLALLLGGGLCYTGASSSTPPTTACATATRCGTCSWRGAALCHFLAVLWHAAPRPA